MSAADISTANNTISIIMAGPLAKNIADEYDVDPRKSASILDIFGGCFQGLLPYSPQVISAAGVAGISHSNVTIWYLSNIIRCLWISSNYFKSTSFKSIVKEIKYAHSIY